jgi:hypothetical protein
MKRRQFITPFGDAMRATSTIPIGSSFAGPCQVSS